MNKTTENLLTWAPLGAGLALMLSDHHRLGLMVAAVSPVTVAVRHPRRTKRALRAVPRSLKVMGREVGRSVGKGVSRGGKHAAHSFRWLAS